MYSVSKGRVMRILHDGPELQEMLVELDGGTEPEKAYNYPGLNRPLREGDGVTLNTSAVRLGLGTGGRHFVIPDVSSRELPFSGHIMKLRYTPWQFPVLAAEEEASPFHTDLEETFTLEGVPVVAAPLHSMLPGVVLGFRQALSGVRQPLRIAYVMTDGAALPLALSNLVREMKKKNLLDAVITAGHAFGGDFEAVSIPSALAVARKAAKADLIVVALGPGIVGTGTPYGFSGIEQSWVIDMTARLEGVPVVVPRISGADPRSRHRGISHHSMTILHMASNPAYVPLSCRIDPNLLDLIMVKLLESDTLSRHSWFWTEEPPVTAVFDEWGIAVKSMGRGVAEDPGFFQSSLAAGFMAAQAYLGKLTALERIIKKNP